MKRRNEEHRIQAGIVRWSRLMEKRYPYLKLLHAIPNGCNRDAATGAAMKREGVLAGIPDLHLPVASGTVHSLYIEVKAPLGRLSKAQKAMRDELQVWGNRVEVVRSTQEGIEVIRDYLGLR